jgi:putative membrane-bound dehydrogenase-like protein
VPGWKLEVVASAPTIRHPSVVYCAPDGRVFVAEDPMDISAPSASLALGRILCLHPEGKVTVFADKLYAVFGLQYLDGKLYVLHNPKFSRFTDDNGIGKDRVDLIESTNPNPWALDWNDHVPANFRLAMDGYLYLAVGDKGVYGAVGRDGKRVDLHGGGILRLRPDGTGLEVFCTGVRNILDVAVNAEDEIFTYDNTDEQEWMGRLTHMVDGGFYGYPYDFLPRRPYTLWMMADYGGGAATGALAYNEDALPLEYRGNLFLADFGKRQLLRVVVARDGGTYRAVSRQDLFIDPAGDFRPVGIALSPDGRSIYLCDWQHIDTKEKVEVGRLLKLTYTGMNRAPPKPSWYLPASMGQKVEASTEELIKGLSHPAQSVRLVAQRRLAERKSAAVSPLIELLKDREAQAPARWHALWALDAIDGGHAARKEILAVVLWGEDRLQRQAIRQLGSRRAGEAIDLLVVYLEDADAGIRFHSATALGRIGHRATVPHLLAALGEKDFFARYAVFTALNRIGRAEPKAWAAIVNGLADDKAAVREGTVLALRETYEESLIDALVGMAGDADRPEQARSAALNLLARVHRKKPDWRGEWWAYHPVNGPPPAKTIAWSGTQKVLAALKKGLGDSSAQVRKAAVEGLQEAKDFGSARLLREAFGKEKDRDVRRSLMTALGSFRDQEAGGLVRAILEHPEEDPRVLADAVSAAEQIGGSDMAAALRAFLRSVPPNRELQIQTVRALGRLKSTAAASQLESLARAEDPEIRQPALEALVDIGGNVGLKTLLGLAEDRSENVRRSAVTALGDLGDRAAVPRLLEAYRARDTHQAAMAALTQIPDARAIEPYLKGLEDRSAELRDKCRKALSRIREQALHSVEGKAGQLPPEVVAQLQQIYRDHAGARKGRLFAVTAKVPDPAEYLEFVRKNPGDAARGKSLFHDRAGLACMKCHKVNGEGGEIGPDLSTIGTQFDRVQLAESVLYPSKSIREGFQQIVVLTRDGRSLTGLVRSESSETLTLRDAEGKDHTVRKADLEERTASKVSLMPEGMYVGLSLDSFSDLVAYLQSLRGGRDQRR